jgi:DMSO/TMAO reductase YedYZ heme-binding membrane subunit
MTVFVALTHASYVVNWYFNFSPNDKYAAVLFSNTSYGQLGGFPFETFGIFALLVLVILAATSHDFWLKFLGPPLWKRLHYLIYPAYVAVAAHGSTASCKTSRTTFSPRSSSPAPGLWASCI